jgi:hypothetical protein
LIRVRDALIKGEQGSQNLLLDYMCIFSSESQTNFENKSLKIKGIC